MLYGATNFPLRPLADEIRTLAGLGFDFLEVCLDPPEASPARIDANLPAIEAAIAETGLKPRVGHLPTFVWLADIYDSIRRASLKEVDSALETCARLGLKKAVVHPGYITGLLTFIPQLGQNLVYRSLEELLASAERLRVTLCLENMFPRAGCFFRPEEFTEVLARYPQLMMTLDLSHGQIQAPPERMAGLIAAGGRRIRHVHVSDNRGQDDEHLPLGTGRVDLAGGFSALKKLGYDDTITLEVFAPDRDYLAMSLSKVKALWEKA
ncbi:MAG: sugar phosphate isomerase/epimerase family protein [Thermodesulfobacteriota bacterium]